MFDLLNVRDVIDLTRGGVFMQLCAIANWCKVKFTMLPEA